MVLLKGDNIDVFLQAIDKQISSLKIEDNELYFEFIDGFKFKIYDDGQSCCEERFMRTDDDLDYYIGSKLMGGELKNTSTDEYGEVHEIQFLEIITDKGSFTVSNHNIHNGYYGGFALNCELLSMERYNERRNEM
jgi:hypothetical protein